MLSPVILALDVDTEDRLDSIIKAVANLPITVKIGMKLYTAYGPKIIERIKEQNLAIFLDLKYHDIPNTVMEAVKEARKLGVDMLTIHASGGAKMIEFASRVIRDFDDRPLILAVTVLTSMDDADLSYLGVTRDLNTQVLELAKLAIENGADGIVCSPNEVSTLKNNLKKNFIAVTPGVRPIGTGADDQKRVSTPKDALTMGADYLVIGRPIYNAPDPRKAILDIFREIGFKI